jgi:hypothetical protein
VCPLKGEYQYLLILDFEYWKSNFKFLRITNKGIKIEGKASKPNERPNKQKKKERKQF